MMFMKEQMVVFICVGLPRSGKTTWAKSMGCPVVNVDEARAFVHGKPFIPEVEAFVWDIVTSKALALKEMLCPRIIIDATNVTQVRRDFWLRLFPDAVVKFKVFTTPVKLCIERALQHDQDYLVPVIQRMAEEWDYDVPLQKD